MQQKLRRLAHRAHKQQQANGGQHRHGHAEEIKLPARQCFGRSEHRIKLQRADGEINRCHAENKAEIADAIDDKSLNGGGIGRGFFEPKADKQIRGKAHTFPTEEQLQKVIRRHQHQHHERKQRQISEKARAVRVVAHIADGINMHQRGHAGDNNKHDRSQRVDAQHPINIQPA